MAVAPYVPTEEMMFLPRDVRRYVRYRSLRGPGGTVRPSRHFHGKASNPLSRQAFTRKSAPSAVRCP